MLFPRFGRLDVYVARCSVDAKSSKGCRMLLGRTDVQTKIK